MHPPLILTLRLDPALTAFLQDARDRHFPRELDIVPAHVTLFHHLPGDAEALVVEEVTLLCRPEPPAPVRITGLRFLGRGVAYTLEAPGPARLRAALARSWHDGLTAQDRQAWRPHATVQNKVATAEARRTEAALQAALAPREGVALGIDIWRYLGGPWQAVASAPFAGAAGAGAPGIG